MRGGAGRRPGSGVLPGREVGGWPPGVCQQSLCPSQLGGLGERPHPGEVLKGPKGECPPTPLGIMRTWAFPAALLLLCLASESLQGGLPPLSPGPGKGFRIPKGYRSGYGFPSGLGAGFGNGNGLGAQPGTGGGVKPQKPGFGNGLAMGTFPGAVAQPGFGGGVRPQKPGPVAQNGGQAPGLGNGNGMGLGAQPGFGNGNGLGGGAFPGVGAQPAGPATQNGYRPGFGGGMKPQKPGLGNGNGLGAQPGLVTQNGYGAGLGGATKPQKPGFGNGDGLGGQPGGPGGLGFRLPATHPGPPYLSLSISTAPAVPVGYGPGIGEGGKLQKPVYRNGLGAGVFPGQGAQPGFTPGLQFPAGYGEEAPVYSKAAVPGSEGNGQAKALRGSSWPSMHPWGLVLKPGYGPGGTYPGVGSQPATYGQLRPELGPGPFGSPPVKRDSSGPLRNGYGGHCPLGKC
ncbi:elastin-like isoform X14 [Neovison vison]|uniref:elastin-like isoform X14 n=1 Tax=Neovison vison TaxID=452646 RepID=UPI001CF04A04|nr:elastin-like isoform X14 [Neogale vison]